MADTDKTTIADQIRANMLLTRRTDGHVWNDALERAAEIAAEGEAALREELRQAYAQIQTDARQLRELAMESMADLGQAQEALERALKAEADRDRLAADLHGPIADLTAADRAAIIAHLSPELEPATPVPSRNSVMMALVSAWNNQDRLAADLAVAREALHKLNVGEGWAAQIARAALARIKEADNG